jgi:hypothetical protein
LKYRHNFAGECAKWPTENSSRNSCLHRRCTPSQPFSTCKSPKPNRTSGQPITRTVSSENSSRIGQPNLVH